MLDEKIAYKALIETFKKNNIKFNEKKLKLIENNPFFINYVINNMGVKIKDFRMYVNYLYSEKQDKRLSIVFINEENEDVITVACGNINRFYTKEGNQCA